MNNDLQDKHGRVKKKINDLDEAAKFRKIKGATAKAVLILALLVSVFEISYLLGLWTTDTFYLDSTAFRAVVLGAVLVIVFLITPFDKIYSLTMVPWYDWLLALLSLVPTLYLAFVAKALASHPASATHAEIALGLLLIALLFEASRRLLGPAIAVICLLFIFYALFGNYVPGVFQSKGYPLDRVIWQTFLHPDGIFGLSLNVAVKTIFAFILFGAFFTVCGGGKFFTDLAFSLVGHVRGGPAKVAIIASSLFGTVSGSAVANVVTTGTFTIPMMKRAGYAPHFAGAVEAVSSTGGQIMPPVMGAMAFLAAEILGVPYFKIALAAALPAILYYIAEYFMVDFEAAKKGLKGLPKEELPKLLLTLTTRGQFILPLAALIYLMGVKGYSAETACLYSIVLTVLVSLLTKETRIDLRKTIAALENTIRGMLDIVVICALIGIIIASVTLTGLGVNLSASLVEISGGSLPALLMMAAVACYILGMGLPTVSAYLLLALLVAPALVNMGVDPIAAHLFILYFGMASHLTPPVAPAAFAGAALAGAPMLKTGFTAMRLGIVCYIIPFFFVYNTALLMIGSLWEIVLVTITSTIGVIALAGGLSGYLLNHLVWLQRIPLITGALLLIAPEAVTDVIGILIVGAIFISQSIQIKRKVKTVRSI